MNKNFWSAVFLLAGTTIGAGVFGIPYATARVGYLIGLVWLVGLSILTILINLAYAVVISRTDHHQPRQFVGYAQYYLGRGGKITALFIILFGLWGTVLAYLIGSGRFLALIFNAGDAEHLFSILVFVFMAIAVGLQVRLVARLEGWFTLGMILVIALVAWSGWKVVDTGNLLATPTISSWQTFLLPYGVIMSALTGYMILPEMRRLYPQGLGRAVVGGTLVPVLVYLVFQFVIVGVSGSGTTEEAIQGLIPYLDAGIVRFGALFGILAMLSSYLTLSYVIKDTFLNDYHWPPVRAWAFAVVPPFIFYLIGLRSFVTALEITGVWLGTLSAGMIFLMFVRSFGYNTDHGRQ